jgi:hypothetical protein
MGFGRALRPSPPRADASRVWPDAAWWVAPTAPIDEAVRPPGTSVTNDRT